MNTNTTKTMRIKREAELQAAIILAARRADEKIARWRDLRDSGGNERDVRLARFQIMVAEALIDEAKQALVDFWSMATDTHIDDDATMTTHSHSPHLRPDEDATAPGGRATARAREASAVDAPEGADVARWKQAYALYAAGAMREVWAAALCEASGVEHELGSQREIIEQLCAPVDLVARARKIAEVQAICAAKKDLIW